MEYKYAFSIVMAIYNVEDYIRESLDSLINQSFDFKENVQLIIVDDESSDNSLNIAKEYQKKYPDNILVLSKENGGPASARNFGLQYVEGRYVNCMDSDDYISLNVLENVFKFFSQHEDEIDFVTVPLERFGYIEGGHPLDYKFQGENRVVDLMEDFEYIQLHLGPTFFKRDTILKYEFDDKLVRSEDAFLINQILLENPKYGLLTDCIYYYRKRFSQSSVTNTAHSKKEFYNYYLKNFYLRLIDLSKQKYGEVLKFIQYLIVYDLKVFVKMDDIPENTLTDSELKEFWKLLREVLSYVDRSIIEDHLKLNHNERSFYFFIKNNEFHTVVKRRDYKVFLKSCDYIIGKLHNHKLRFYNIDYVDDNFVFYAYIASNCKPDPLFLKAHVTIQDGEFFTVKSETLDYPPEGKENRKYLGVEWLYYSHFLIKIPVDKKKNYKLTIKLYYDENDKRTAWIPPIKFNEECNITEDKNYHIKSSKVILYQDDAFHLVNASFKFKSKLRLQSITKK